MSEDIIIRLEKDFASDSQTALSILVDFECKNDLSERVTRCLIVLSKGNVEQLKKYIASAEADWRDVIFLAEKYALQCNEPFTN
jgi:uroporphyrinogen-III synthase